MSYYPTSYDLVAYESADPEMAMLAYEQPRSALMVVLLAVPVILSLVSWLGGGVTILTDTAFAWLLASCIFAVCRELLFFPKRLGIAPLTLFGGTMVWYCQDYFSHWFGIDFQHIGVPFPAGVVAKAAFFTCLFVWTGSMGLLLPTFHWPERIIHRLPEPQSSSVYKLVIAGALLFGISPYFLFNRDPFYIGIYKSIIGMRSADGASWTVGRTGNMNSSWGAYIAQVLEVGDVGGILAAFFAIMIPTNLVSRIVCLGIWLLWAAIEFGSGSRGEFLFVMLPVVGLIWIKYSAQAMQRLQVFSKKAIFYSGIAMAILLFAVQIQGTFRNEGLRAADVSQVQLFKNQGNTMFSEGLLGYQIFPDIMTHPYDRFPGEGVIRFPIETTIRFAIGWIPRVLWPGKPGIDAIGQMINEQMTGGTATNGSGGTVATSIAGGSFIYFGTPGVIEMGLLFGWLCHCCAGALRSSLGRPFALLMTLGFATWLFRCFRDLTPMDLYPLLIGGCGVIVIYKLMPKPQTNS